MEVSNELLQRVYHFVKDSVSAADNDLPYTKEDADWLQDGSEICGELYMLGVRGDGEE